MIDLETASAEEILRWLLVGNGEGSFDCDGIMGSSDCRCSVERKEYEQLMGRFGNGQIAPPGMGDLIDYLHDKGPLKYDITIEASFPNKQIKMEEQLPEAEIERIKADFEKELQGTENNGCLFVSSPGLGLMTATEALFTKDEVKIEEQPQKEETWRDRSPLL